MRTMFLFLAMLASAIAQPFPVTLDQAPNATPAGGSFAPVVDASGRRVAFVSSARNISLRASGQHLDMFVKELDTGWMRHVSSLADRASTGDSLFPALNATGDLLAFSSESDT